MSILDQREKTHGSYTQQAALAQDLKTRIRAECRNLVPQQQESLEMICVKIARIVCGNPHEVDHWRDIAGYAALIERWLTSCTASGDGPTRRPGECNPATPVPSQAASVWPLTLEEEEERAAQRRG